MSKVSFNIDTIFGITLIVLLLWLVGWWVAIGWKKNERRGWSLNRRMVTSIFLFLFSIGSMIIISWRFINDRLPIDFGGLMISVGALFGIYSLGLEKGNFHRYKGFWIYLLGGIVSLVWWIFLIYIDYIK